MCAAATVCAAAGSSMFARDPLRAPQSVNQPEGYAWMANRWCTAAQALSGRGGPGRLVAGDLGVGWLCLPLVAAGDAATFVIPSPIRSRDLLSCAQAPIFEF